MYLLVVTVPKWTTHDVALPCDPLLDLRLCARLLRQLGLLEKLLEYCIVSKKDLKSASEVVELAPVASEGWDLLKASGLGEWELHYVFGLRSFLVHPA